ncbi:MAG: type II toxin-antitoxin system HigA family antitoxin [bacterium]
MDAHLNEMTEIWPIASKYISVLHTKAQYENSVKTLDKLIDEVGSNESHPLASLMETLAILIENYEDRHYPEPDADPIDCLKYLMQEHNLKQTDLPEIGSQGVVSEILNRKRQLTIRQIRALSNRFGVSPAVFI